MDMGLVWCILLAYVMLASGTDDNCDPNPCQNNGTCLFYDNKINCICEGNLIGPRCEKDPCVPNSCENNGRCEYNVDERRVMCEPVVDVCWNHLCENGGRCEMENEAPICICTTPYTGENCEKDPCQPNPCNNGSCIISDTKISCICKEPFTGPNCEEHPCVPNPCENNGHCEYNSDERGVMCEAVVDLCSNHSCENGGRCEMENKAPKCICTSPYTGENCEKVTDPCKPNPCNNNGLCRVQNDKAVCICVELFGGQSCQINPCVPNPCKNNGQCKVHLGKAACTCNSPSHTGQFCDEVLDLCEQTECQNGGSCQRENGKCNCSTPFTGEYCEIEVSTVSEKESSSVKPKPETIVTDPVSPSGSPIPESTISIYSSTAVAATEVSTRNTNQNFHTSSNEISIPNQSSSHEPVIVSSADPGSSDGATNEINLSTTEIFEVNSTDNSANFSSPDPRSSEVTTTEEIGPNIEFSTIEVSYSDEESSFYETSSITGDKEGSTTETSTDDDVKKNEISEGPPKTVAYVCGATGAILGLFLLVAAIVHFSKRWKTKKRTHSFQNADNTSIGSATSVSNLV